MRVPPRMFARCIFIFLAPNTLLRKKKRKKIKDLTPVCALTHSLSRSKSEEEEKNVERFERWEDNDG